MRTAGIAGYRRRRRVRTTRPEPANQKVPDLLGRDFTATVPNNKYVGDITYLPLPPGHQRVCGRGDRLLLTPCRRVGDRRSHAHRTRRRYPQGRRRAAGHPVRVHSDHGRQYTARDFAQPCKDLGVTQSLVRIGHGIGANQFPSRRWYGHTVPSYPQLRRLDIS